VTTTLNDDYRDMLAALVGAGAEFLVVGAHALAAHGLPRATGDIDILVRPTPANAMRVMRALVDFGAPVEAHGVGTTDFEIEGTVYQLGVAPQRIDILTAITGVSFDEAWSSRVPVNVGGVSFHVLGRDALIRNKRAAGRAKDIVDAEALENAK
jgi:hypothetical protein